MSGSTTVKVPVSVDVEKERLVVVLKVLYITCVSSSAVGLGSFISRYRDDTVQVSRVSRRGGNGAVQVSCCQQMWKRWFYSRLMCQQM